MAGASQALMQLLVSAARDTLAKPAHNAITTKIRTKSNAHSCPAAPSLRTPKAHIEDIYSTQKRPAAHDVLC
ncbi:MAG: hypothetical protein ABL897_13965 [Hyphomicrobium sp.]